MVRNALRYVLERRGPAGRHAHGVRDAASTASPTATAPTFAWDGRRPTATASRSATSASRFSRTDHPVETLAVRVERGGRVARLLGRHRARTGRSRRFGARHRPGAVRGHAAATSRSGTRPAPERPPGRGVGARGAAPRACVLTHLWPGSRSRRAAGPRPRPPSAGRSSVGRRPTRGTSVMRPLRADGRDARRAAPDHLRAGLHRHAPPGSVLVSLRPDPGAVHRVGRRGRAPLDAGQGQGLGHRRVLDAAGLVGRADPPGGARTASRRAAPRRSSG